MKLVWHRLLATVAAMAVSANVTAGVGGEKIGRASAADSKSPPVALITGSDRGIGFALVHELAARGWRVIATCRDPGNAEALKTFAAGDSRVVVEALDVADDAAIEALSTRYRGQPIDALVNNAGIAGGLGSESLANLSPEEFTKVFARKYLCAAENIRSLPGASGGQ